jgi:hypothetical protein
LLLAILQLGEVLVLIRVSEHTRRKKKETERHEKTGSFHFSLPTGNLNQREQARTPEPFQAHFASLIHAFVLGRDFCSKKAGKKRL